MTGRQGDKHRPHDRERETETGHPRVTKAIAHSSYEHDEDPADERGDGDGEIEHRGGEPKVGIHRPSHIEEGHGKEPEGEEAADKSEEDPVVASKGGGGYLIHR